MVCLRERKELSGVGDRDEWVFMRCYRKNGRGDLIRIVWRHIASVDMYMECFACVRWRSFDEYECELGKLVENFGRLSAQAYVRIELLAAIIDDSI